jgi:hypothetical protein
VFGIILEAVGGVLYAIIIAALTSIVTSTDSNKREVTERLDMVSSYVDSRRFPEYLGRRVRRYFRHFYESKTAIDEQQILSDLPTSLRHEVSSFLVSGLMNNVALFRDLSPVLWAQILPLLRPCRFETGDIVSKQDEECVEAFILLEGEARGLTVYDPNNFEARAARLRMPQANAAALNNTNNAATHQKALEHLDSHTAMLLESGAQGPSITRRGSVMAVRNMFDGLADILTPSRRRQGAEGEGLDDEEEFEGRDGGGGRSPIGAPHSMDDSSVSVAISLGQLKNTQKKKAAGGKVAPEEEGTRRISLDPNVHSRSLVAGDMVNVLCILKVWERCLETVVCSDPTEFYAIHSQEFSNIFGRYRTLYQEMKEQVVLTSFRMYKDPGMEAAEERNMDSSLSGDRAGTAGGLFGGGGAEYGVPMYMYSREEADFRTEAYEARKQAQADAYVATVRKNDREANTNSALKRVMATNKAANMFKAKGKLAILGVKNKGLMASRSSVEELDEPTSSGPTPSSITPVTPMSGHKAANAFAASLGEGGGGGEEKTQGSATLESEV